MKAYLRATAFFALLCGAACGGADSQDVFAGAPGAASDGGASSSSSSASSSGSASSSSSTSSSSSSGSSGTTDSGTDAGIDTGLLCPQETEPNNGRPTANTIATSICGTIDPASDDDFLTFQIGSTTTDISMTYTGDVFVQVSVDGAQTVTLGDGNKIPIVKDGRYYVEVRGVNGATNLPWRVNLSEM